MPLWSWGCFWHSTCLQPTYLLRRQLFFSFGATGIVTTVLVVILACLCAISAGNLVQREAQNFMRQEVISSISNSSQLAAETLSQELDHLRGTLALIVEVTRDRIAGYPQPGWEEDLFVPFDVYPNTNNNLTGGAQPRQVYPLNSALLPRDWNTPLNVNISNHEEHLQELFTLLDKQHVNAHDTTLENSFSIFRSQPQLSTASAVYTFQGNCDPSVTNRSDPTYYPECTSDNNNGSTGGVVWPTSTSAGLEQKAADIGVLLKPIWESRPDVLEASVHFVNDGAGSTVQFPSFVHKNDPASYQSIGCDWLHENINPYTNRPFLTRAQTAKCKPAGTWVPRRESNPMEQDWCRDQALHPEETRFYGPVVDKLFSSEALRLNIAGGEGHDSHFWVVIVGRAIFDRYSGEFVGCAAMTTLTNRLTKLVTDTFQVQDHSEGIVIRADDGSVVAGGGWDLYHSKNRVHVTNTSLVPSESLYEELVEELTALILAEDRRDKSGEEEVVSIPTAVVECSTGRIVSASAIPGSNLIYIQSVDEVIFEVIDDIKKDIDDDVTRSVVLALFIGGLGIILLMAIVYTVSNVLTHPFQWMQQIAWSIVNHRSSVNAFDEKSGLIGQDSHEASPAYTPLKCTPTTEITELVNGFEKMIQGFSGPDGASTVAQSVGHEIRNTLAWHNHSDATSHIGGSESQLAREVSLASTSNSSSATGDDDSGPRVCAGQEAPSQKSVGSASDCHFRSTKTDSAGGILTPPNMDLLEKAQPEEKHMGSLPTATTQASLLSSLNPSKLKYNGEWKNEGRNLTPLCSPELTKHDRRAANCALMKSKLFRWVVVLIVIPMVVTNTVIAAMVSHRVLSLLPIWLENVEGVSYGIQIEDMAVTSRFASIYAEAKMATPIRDLFVVTRLAQWLFADAIEREASAFVEMRTGVEDCKDYSEDVKQCPYMQDVNNIPCDCAWSKPQSRICMAFDEGVDTRRMQKLFFASKRTDADPMTGNRAQSSFPQVDSTPGNTSWWKEVSDVPGAQKGSEAAGHETTYDRLKVLAALSAMIFPVYNGRSAMVHAADHRFMGISLGFEADGMLAGWTGCGYPSPRYAHWQSAEWNHADKIRPDLCPLGSYGYDSRCRDWYDAGKSVANSTETSLFVTAPYTFPRSTLQGSSVTQALVDSKTGEHFGQVLVDFFQFEMKGFGLENAEDRFHIVITPSIDIGGGDTAIGPDPDDRLAELNTNAVGDRVLPYDRLNSTNRAGFDVLVDNMKAGQSCYSSELHQSSDHASSTIHEPRGFTRVVRQVDKDGATLEKEEVMRIAYDPIRVRALDAVQPNDYSRGLDVSKSLVYSVGVARSEASLEKPFKDFREDAWQTLQKNVTIYLAVIVVISLVATAITCRLSVVITRPMVILLNVVQNVNDGKVEEAIPPLHGGSREVNQVYTSFAKLYKIVRVSNGAFFSRNLNWAYHFVRDALELFTKIDDKKAIAIASSNLGNTLLVMNCGRAKEDRCCCLQVDGACCVSQASIHFETAVQSGTKDFTNAADLNEKVEFAQQLSNRLFNRGLYFLLSKEDPCADETFEERGVQDLMKAQALDHDVQEYWIENGLLMQKSSVLFECLLRRLNGLCALLENKIEQTVWDVQTLAHDCHHLLMVAWEDSSTLLFEDYTQTGRLQQLEGVLVQLQLQRNEKEESARIALRMLVEDEYICERAFRNAATAVVQFVENGQSLESLAPLASLSKLPPAAAKTDLEKMLKSCRQRSSNQARKCMFLCLDLCNDNDANTENTNLEELLMDLYDSNCGNVDFFGLATRRGTQLPVELSDAQQRGVHKKGIEDAMNAMLSPDSSFPVSSLGAMSTAAKLDFLSRIKNANNKGATATILSKALDAILESDASSIYDTYLVFVTDESKQNWDGTELSGIKARLEEINAKRRVYIHLIIVDLEERPATPGAKTNGSAAYTSLCQVSQGSAYIPASMDNLEEDFERMKTALSAGNKLSGAYSSALMSGVTMEKF